MQLHVFFLTKPNNVLCAVKNNFILYRTIFYSIKIKKNVCTERKKNVSWSFNPCCTTKLGEHLYEKHIGDDIKQWWDFRTNKVPFFLFTNMEILIVFTENKVQFLFIWGSTTRKKKKKLGRILIRERERK